MTPDPNTSHVLLLHGIGRTRRSMGRLEAALRVAGFATTALTYPSRRHRIETLVDFVCDNAGGWAEATGPKLILGHSMGGLVARGLLNRYRPAGCVRVVMLGTPNEGSELADLLAGNPIYDWAFGPAGRQLGRRRDAATKAILGQPDYELGVIAGKRVIEPLNWLYLPKPNDGKVSVAATRVAGMTDHLILNLSHDGMLRSRVVAAQAIAFFRTGRFAMMPA